MDIFTHKQPRNINRSAELTGNDRFVSVYLLTKAIINIHYYHQPLTRGYSDFLPNKNIILNLLVEQNIFDILSN